MAALQITITDAGRAEIINAANTGTAPVEITEVGLGTGQYTPDPTQTALTNEVKRLNTISGEVVADDTIHVTVKDEGGDAYDVAEFGLFTASGTLFAVYSQASGPFMQKAAQSSLLLSVDVILGTLDATNLTFGDTSFSNPPASETVAGVIELADATEATEGTNNTKAMTPAKVLAALNSTAFQASETKRGSVELATATEALAGTDNQRAMTPARVQERLGNLADVISYSSAGAIPAADAGKLIRLGGAGVTRTLPSAATVRAGSVFTIQHTGTTGNMTIQASGSDVIDSGATSSASISLGLGETAIITALGSTTWNAFIVPSVDSSFAASLTWNGWQKLPSGLIIQWGTGLVLNGAVVVFPIAFPNNCRFITMSPIGAVAEFTAPNNVSTTGFTAHIYNDTGAGIQREIYWTAIGY